MRHVIHLNGVPQSLACACVLSYETWMRSWPTALFTVAVAFAASDCSGRVLPSNSTKAASDDDGSASGSDSGAESDGSACSAPATGACNSGPLQGPWVTRTVSSVANAPSLQGGAISDGTYVLTAVTTYEATAYDTDSSVSSQGSPERATLVVAAGCIQWDDSQLGSMWSSHPSNDQLLTFEQECPAHGTWWAGYAASTTTLELAPVSAESAPVYTFARQ